MVSEERVQGHGFQSQQESENSLCSMHLTTFIFSKLIISSFGLHIRKLTHLGCIDHDKCTLHRDGKDIHCYTNGHWSQQCP